MDQDSAPACANGVPQIAMRTVRADPIRPETRIVRKTRLDGSSNWSRFSDMTMCPWKLGGRSVVHDVQNRKRRSIESRLQ